MREKLKNSRGETLVEVLASVLVCSLSIMLLAGAVSASTSIDLQAQAADAEYYEVLSRAERQSKEAVPSSDPGNPDEADIYTGTLTGTKITMENQDGISVDIVPGAGDGLFFYGRERLLSYAMDPLPTSSGTGDGP